MIQLLESLHSGDGFLVLSLEIGEQKMNVIDTPCAGEFIKFFLDCGYSLLKVVDS